MTPWGLQCHSHASPLHLIQVAAISHTWWIIHSRHHMSSLVSPFPSPPPQGVDCIKCVSVLSYLAVKQQVQLPVDPLLDVQPPLQVLAVVLHCQLAQFTMRRLFCLVLRLEHHPGLGAGIWRHGCHGLEGTVEANSSLSVYNTSAAFWRADAPRRISCPQILVLCFFCFFLVPVLVPCLSSSTFPLAPSL